MTAIFKFCRVHGFIFSSQKTRSNSQLGTRDAVLSDPHCFSCSLPFTDTECVLTSPLYLLACGVQSWIALRWSESCIFLQNRKQLKTIHHTIFHISNSPSGNKCFKTKADMGTSARNGDDDNTSIVKPKERFALKGEQERGRKLFFWNQFKVFEFRNLKKKTNTFVPNLIINLLLSSGEALQCWLPKIFPTSFSELF